MGGRLCSDQPTPFRKIEVQIQRLGNEGQRSGRIVGDTEIGPGEGTITSGWPVIREQYGTIVPASAGRSLFRHFLCTEASIGCNVPFRPSGRSAAGCLVPGS